MRALRAGDLLIRECDKHPCVVTDSKESEKKEWGTLDANRRLYKLFDGSGRAIWISDTEIRARYTLPSP